MSKLMEQINKVSKTNGSLASFIDLISGGTPKTTVKEYWDGDIPWLSVVDFNNDSRWVSNAEKKITKEGVENSSTRILERDDIIISARGTVGAMAQLSCPMAFNQSCYGIRSKTGVDQSYLFYLLKSSIPKLIQIVHGAVFDTITKDSFEQVEVSIPDLSTQKKIAEILNAYDAKIENNNKIIKNLEATAQAIFNEWFINFRFPGYKKVKMIASEMGKIPEGWEIKSLDKIAEFLNGVASQKYPAEDANSSLPVIKIREMNSGIDKNSDRATRNIESKYIIKNGDILFAWSGSLSLMIWVGGEGVLNQHIFKVTSESYPKWFIYYWTNKYLQNFRVIAEGKATTMGHIQRHHLTESKVVAPNEIILKKANIILEPIFNQQILLQEENISLKSQRDQLLVKLI